MYGTRSCRDRDLGDAQNSRFYSEPAVVFGGCKIRRPDLAATRKCVSLTQCRDDAVERESLSFAGS